MSYLPLLSLLVLQAGHARPTLEVTADAKRRAPYTDFRVSFRWLSGPPILDLKITKAQGIGANVTFGAPMSMSRIDKDSSYSFGKSVKKGIPLNEDIRILVIGSYRQGNKTTNFNFRLPLESYKGR